MFVYYCNAIDDWSGWQDPVDLFRPYLWNKAGLERDIYLDGCRWKPFWDEAQALARSIGWEGDIRDGPYVTVIPPRGSGEEPLLIVAWKQDNNGDTMIASDVELPWVDMLRSTKTRA